MPPSGHSPQQSRTRAVRQEVMQMRYASMAYSPLMLSFTALLLAPSSLAAQTELKPGDMLQVNCETVKFGMGPAHDKNEERWARAVEGVKGFAPTLAMQSASGPGVSCWFTATKSYEDLMRSNNALTSDPMYASALSGLMQSDAPFVSEARTYIAVLRRDLSSGELPNVLTRRMTSWSEFRVRAGPNEALFDAAVKAYRAAAERAGSKPEFRVFQVRQGAPGGTYWILNSATTAAGFDAMMANDEKAMTKLTPEEGKAMEDYFAKVHLSVTENLWTYVPSQSSLTAEQRATDPFWARKVQVARRP